MLFHLADHRLGGFAQLDFAGIKDGELPVGSEGTGVGYQLEDSNAG